MQDEAVSRYQHLLRECFEEPRSADNIYVLSMWLKALPVIEGCATHLGHNLT